MSDPQTHIKGATAIDLVFDRSKVNALIDRVLALAESHAFGSSALFAMRLAIEEAITNAFEHGHAGLDPATPIHVEYAVTQDAVEIAIEDQGTGFTPSSLPDPTLLENLSKPSGRGVMLMRAYMSDVHFNEQGNRVKLRYARNAHAN